MVSPEFAALIKIGSERTFTTERGFGRSFYYNCSGTLFLLAAFLELLHPYIPFLPHPLISCIFSIPLFALGALYTISRKMTRLTLCSAGIRWRNKEIMWSEVISISESCRNFLSLEVETKDQKVSIPLAGMEHIHQVRNIVQSNANYLPLKLPQKSPKWLLLAKDVLSFLFIDLALLVSFFALISNNTFLQLPHVEYKFFDLLYRQILTIATIILLTQKSPSNWSLDQKTIIDASGITKRSYFKKELFLPYEDIRTLCRKSSKEIPDAGLMIQSEFNQIWLDHSFPNYPQVVEEICRRTGLEVQDA